MDEKLNFDGMKFIRVIMVFRRTPLARDICDCWMAFVNDPYVDLYILHIFQSCEYNNYHIWIILIPWLTTSSKATWILQKDTKYFFLQIFIWWHPINNPSWNVPSLARKEQCTSRRRKARWQYTKRLFGEKNGKGIVTN